MANWDMAQDDVFKQIDQNHKRYVDRETEKLIKKSVAPKGKERRVIEKWKPSFKSVMTVTVVATMFIAILANMIQSKIEKDNKFKAALEYASSKSEIVTITNDAERTYREPGKKDYVNDHETYEIANYLVNKSDDFHNDLFMAYNEINKNSEYVDADVERVMDEILARTSQMNDENNPNNILDYNSFSDYQEKHEFLDKDKKPSTNVYEDKMGEKIVDEYELYKINNEHGLRGGR